jgi:hypothetical protein
MEKSMKKKWLGAFLAIAALMVTGTVLAQAGLLIGGHEANFGSHSLRAGFLPDPKVIRVTSGGDIDASTLGLGAGCGGFVTRRPDAIVQFEGNTELLRFYVAAQGDTTLVINDPHGNWHCNDDSADGNLNPMVDVGHAGPGQYDIWVGSYRSDEQIRGTLNVTEIESNSP